jgi:hypothetical protein
LLRNRILGFLSDFPTLCAWSNNLLIRKVRQKIFFSLVFYFLCVCVCVRKQSNSSPTNNNTNNNNNRLLFLSRFSAGIERVVSLRERFISPLTMKKISPLSITGPHVL